MSRAPLLLLVLTARDSTCYHRFQPAPAPQCHGLRVTGNGDRVHEQTLRSFEPIDRFPASHPKVMGESYENIQCASARARCRVLSFRPASTNRARRRRTSKRMIFDNIYV